MNKDNRLLELTAAISMNKAIGIYTAGHSEIAGEILEVVIRRHFGDGREDA